MEERKGEKKEAKHDRIRMDFFSLCLQKKKNPPCIIRHRSGKDRIFLLSLFLPVHFVGFSLIKKIQRGFINGFLWMTFLLSAEKPQSIPLIKAEIGKGRRKSDLERKRERAFGSLLVAVAGIRSRFCCYYVLLQRVQSPYVQ